MNSIKKIIINAIPETIYSLWQRINKKRYYEQWVKLGFPLPPPHTVKQEAIKYFKEKYQYNIFIETGTYLGDMVFALRNHFSKIISIELDNKLYLRAKKRFKKFKHIDIINGDSGIVLNRLVKSLNSSAIFWLDGHYSGGFTAQGQKVSPIFEELDAILESNYSHILLIDDARLFTGKGGYPTIEELKVLFLPNNQITILK